MARGNTCGRPTVPNLSKLRIKELKERFEAWLIELENYTDEYTTDDIHIVEGVADQDRLDHISVNNKKRGKVGHFPPRRKRLDSIARIIKLENQREANKKNQNKKGDLK